MSESRLDTAKIVNAALPDFPIWKSKIFVGAAIAVLMTIAKQFGWIAAITPEGQEQAADLISAALQGGGALMAAIARLTQKAAPPLSITGGK